MFYGEQDYSIDDKGRMLIPKEYRAELGESIMLMRGVDGQLYIYPKQVFDEKRQRMAQFDDTESFRLTRLAFNTAVGCEVDKQGRILIPLRLRAYAGLDGQVVIAGNEDHLEVWNSDEYENAFVRLKNQFRQKPEEFTKIREAGLHL